MKAEIRGPKLNFRRTYETVTDVLDSAAAIQPERGFGYIDADGSEEFIAYPELRKYALRYLKGLQEKGIKKGDIVGIETDSPKEYHFIFWACMFGGIVACPINTPVSWNIEHEAVKGFGRLWDRLDKAVIITSDSHAQYFEVLKSSEEFMDLKYFTVNELLMDEEGKKEEVDMDGLAYMLLSSGSTGDPKIICLSYNAVLFSVLVTADSLDFKDDEKTISWLPHTHNLGIFVPMLVAMMSHNVSFFMKPGTFLKDPLLYLKKMKEHGITWICSNNSGLSLMSHSINEEVIKEISLPEFKSAVAGAEQITKSTIESLKTNFGKMGSEDLVIRPGYGLSESTCATCVDTPDTKGRYINVDRVELINGNVVDLPMGDRRSSNFATVGVPMPEIEMKICDGEGNTLDENKVGELLIKSAGSYMGRYNHGIEAPSDIKDGWLKTGDLALIRDGFIYIVGRIKDVIVIRGVNYMASDIDRIAGESVKDFGIPQGSIVSAGCKAEEGEELLIFVEYHGDMDRFPEIMERISENLGHMLGIVVKTIIPTEKIERTGSGKIQRFRMQMMYENGDFSENEEKVNSLLKGLKKPVNEEYLPDTEIEHILCDTIADVLNIDKAEITLDKPFYMLGGQSVDFYRVINALEGSLGTEIDQGIAMKAETLERLAEYLEETAGETIGA